MRIIRTTLMIALLVGILALATTALASANDNFRAHLSGKDAGVETQAQGQAIFRFKDGGTKLYFKVNVANLDGITMAHIHLYTSEAGGPPVVWLIPDGPPPLSEPLGRVNGTLVEGTIDASRLVGPLAGMTLEDLRTAIENGDTYVNVHTVDYPAGEIRGDVH